MEYLFARQGQVGVLLFIAVLAVAKYHIGIACLLLVDSPFLAVHIRAVNGKKKGIKYDLFCFLKRSCVSGVMCVCTRLYVEKGLR